MLLAKRTATGRRSWLERDLDAYLGRTSTEGPKRGVAYGRVSSGSQRAGLNNQRRIVEEFCLAKEVAPVEFLEEIGGGLNFQRPKFLALVNFLVSGEISMLILRHPDHGQIGFRSAEAAVFQTWVCELLVLNTEQVSPEEEMVQDFMAIPHGFPSRLEGLWNYRKALKDALK